jgi:hypothetical protein
MRAALFERVIAFNPAPSGPQRLDLYVERLRERAPPCEFWKSQRAIDPRHILFKTIFVLSVAHWSTGRSSSFFEECLYRLRYNSASIIALCMRASAMASKRAMLRRPIATNILCRRPSNAFGLFKLRQLASDMMMRSLRSGGTIGLPPARL